MSPTVRGRIVDEDGSAWAGLRAEIPAEYLLNPKRYRSDPTGADGTFSVKVPDVTDMPDVDVRAVDAVLRPLCELKRVVLTGDPVNAGDITVRRADRNGLLVTQLTGTAKFVSQGNALKVLVDGVEAFGRVVDELERVGQMSQSNPAVSHRVDMTQLFFATPPEFDNDPAKETPKLIFRFVPPTIVPITTPNTAPVPRPGDKRPERMLLDLARASNPVKTRILLNHPSLGWPEGVLWLVALPLAAAGVVGAAAGLIGLAAGIGWALFFPVAIPVAIVLYFVEIAIARGQLAAYSHVEELTAYFEAALGSSPARQQIDVRGFKQPIPDHGVMHPKMLIVDGERAVVLGSPFGQRYYDDELHPIEDPRRGHNTSPVVHDVSVAVIGPAVRHIDETFHTFWNEDLSTPAPQPATSPAAQTQGEDGIAEIQIVRTMSGQRFESLNDRSEKGILESYLRAFAAAKHFIFVETQYFTDSVITDALEQVLKTTSVQVILLLNIKPDILRYPERQGELVQRLRKAGAARLGVFTRWSYDHTRTPPWVAPVYLHTKAAVVDDTWATIGSANLDGLSLDYNMVFSPLVVGETTATEVNVNIFNGGAHPASPLVDLVRRRLWAEHLGFLGTGGTPDPGDSRLTRPLATTDWLDLWTREASKASDHVTDGRSDALPGFVLDYPDKDGGSLKEPAQHLRALLGVELRVRPIGTIRSFDFFTQRWENETGEDPS